MRILKSFISNTTHVWTTPTTVFMSGKKKKKKQDVVFWPD